MFLRSTVKVARTLKPVQVKSAGTGFVTRITSVVITGASAAAGSAVNDSMASSDPAVIKRTLALVVLVVEEFIVTPFLSSLFRYGVFPLAPSAPANSSRGLIRSVLGSASSQCSSARQH